ncbi:MAG: carboxymuconolactone decarboxylase family protein [Proteobacteria bacterium]|nr:carboxymuconolactone decarboxylase family protein [Pseudomonadota bacterium]
MTTTTAPGEALPLTAAQMARGDWNPLWDTLREWDPAFVEGYLTMRAAAFGRGPLDAKTKELVLVALNAATTHLYAPGVRRHIGNALAHGATRDEILQVIELATVLGIHACNLAVPILKEELAANEARGPAG